MMKHKNTPTLDDVAQRAGVSTATVSRCLNMPDRVLEKTRKRVQKTIDELGYVPNFGARVMAAKRTFTIGAIIPTMENAIFAKGLQAFQEEIHRRGYTLLVSSSAYQPTLEEEQIRTLIARGADGVLLIGYERSADIYRYLEQQNKPALVAWAYSEAQPLPSVGFNNYTSMQALAEIVFSYGHKNIGVISGRITGNDRAASRLKAIQDLAAQQAGARIEVIETGYDVENGARAFETLMQAAEPPSVIMCGNDVLAVGALGAAHKLGLRVPQDVSITGFDDIELARIVTPQLTTVHVPHREMGRRAAVELIQLVEKQSAGQAVELASAVKLRQSLKPLSD